MNNATVAKEGGRRHELEIGRKYYRKCQLTRVTEEHDRMIEGETAGKL